MIKIFRIMEISTLLLMVLLVSGCYTIIGHPSPAEEGMVEGKTEKEQIYRYYGDEYKDLSPYYGSYHDLEPYYGFWYPGSYYYGGYYGGYYSRYSRWYDDYYSYPRYYYDRDYYYHPEGRPAAKKRGSGETIERVPRTENKPGPRIENLEESSRSEKRASSRQKTEREIQRTPKKRRDTSSEINRSSKRKAEDDEE